MSVSREPTSAPRAGGFPDAIARIVDVVVDPRAAFLGIAERPPWLAGLIVVICARFLSLFVFYQPDATPLKLVTGIVFQIAMVTPLLLASATLLWASCRLWRAPLRWITAFSIAVHVLVAYTIATIAVASVAGAVLPASIDVDLREPPFMNLGELVDARQSPLFARLLGEADIRSVYALVLVMFGVRAARPAERRVRILGAVMACFAVRVAAVALAAA